MTEARAAASVARTLAAWLRMSMEFDLVGLSAQGGSSSSWGGVKRSASKLAVRRLFVGRGDVTVDMTGISSGVSSKASRPMRFEDMQLAIFLFRYVLCIRRMLGSSDAKDKISRSIRYLGMTTTTINF